jgi:hypothetical protein
MKLGLDGMLCPSDALQQTMWTPRKTHAEGKPNDCGRDWKRGCF